MTDTPQPNLDEFELAGRKGVEVSKDLVYATLQYLVNISAEQDVPLPEDSSAYFRRLQLNPQDKEAQKWLVTHTRAVQRMKDSAEFRSRTDALITRINSASNPFEILGVPPGSDAKTCEKAWKSTLSQLHIDNVYRLKLDKDLELKQKLSRAMQKLNGAWEAIEKSKRNVAWSTPPAESQEADDSGSGDVSEQLFNSIVDKYVACRTLAELQLQHGNTKRKFGNRFTEAQQQAIDEEYRFLLYRTLHAEINDAMSFTRMHELFSELNAEKAQGILRGEERERIRERAMKRLADIYRPLVQSCFTRSDTEWLKSKIAPDKDNLAPDDYQEFMQHLNAWL